MPVILALLGGPAPANAFEIFGLNLFGGDTQEIDPQAAPIGSPVAFDARLELSEASTPEALDRAVIMSASFVLRQAEDPSLSQAGLLAEARGDYRRILGALYAEGRYGATVSVTANGREVDQLAVDAELALPIAIVISVDPGPVYRFADLQIINPAPQTVRLDDQVAGFAELKFTPGSVASSTAIRRAEGAIVEGWRQQGYPLAQRIQRSVIADHATQTVDVKLGADAGPRAVFGAVQVQGSDRMNPDYIAFMTGLVEGQEYDPDAVREAQDRLASLEVFRSVRVETADTVGPDGTLPVTIVIQERPLRRIGVGATYSTAEGAGVEAFWLHRNLFGQAERLRLEGQVSGVNSVEPEDFSYRFGASLRRPGIMTPDTVGTANLVVERTVLDAYTQTGVSGSVGLEHPFSQHLTGRISLEGRYAEFRDDVFGVRDFSSIGFAAGLVFDNRDDPANATQGVFLEAELAPFFEFSRSEPGVALLAEGRTYQSLSEDDRIILAARLKIGTLIGPSIANTAPDRLFLAGGGSSVRGYGYRTIGVQQPGGEITGGRSLIEGSVEVRARFTPTIGGVLFADAGHVGPASVLDFEDDLKVGVGAGLRYLTPLGPIRLDVGVPLNPESGDPDFAVYIGIGQAF